MKSLSAFLQEKIPAQQHSQRMVLDEKTIFFLFGKIVRDYYGERGVATIYPLKYEGNILTVKVASPLWANELLIQRAYFCERLNQEIGFEVIQDLRVVHGLGVD